MNTDVNTCKTVSISCLELSVTSEISLFGAKSVSGGIISSSSESIVERLRDMGISSKNPLDVEKFFMPNPLYSTIGITTNRHIGHSVALSGDGHTAVVGSGFDSSGSFGQFFTYVDIYTKSLLNNAWYVQTTISADDENHMLGRSLALDFEGNNLVVGSANGTVTFYSRSIRTWTSLDTVPGYKVSISKHGTVAAITSDTDNSVNVYTRSGSTWTLQDNLPATVVLTSDPEGIKVVISGSGLVVLFSVQGKCFMYKNVSGTWTAIPNPNSSDLRWFANSEPGDCLALDYTGETAAFGAKTHYITGINAGSVSVYKNGYLVPGAKSLFGSGKQIGTSITNLACVLSESGDKLVFSDSTGRGQLWKFNLIDSVWKQIGSRITYNGTEQNTAGFGYSLAGSADTSVLIAGAPFSDNYQIASLGVGSSREGSAVILYIED
jgi:hypothetical protein